MGWKRMIIDIGLTGVKLVGFLSVPVALFYLMESYVMDSFGRAEWTDMYEIAHFYNILLFELIALILFFLTGSARIALRIETVAAMVFGLLNYYVMEFRSSPFVPWDIFSWDTAASVAGNYDYTFTEEMLKISLGFLAIFGLVQLIDLKIAWNWKTRLIPLICGCLVLGGFSNLLQKEEFQSDSGLYPFLFTPSVMCKRNGTLVTFVMDMAYLVVEKPMGYDPKQVEQLLDSYGSDGSYNENRPNIIVIMNEAFSDLQVLGNLTTSEDCMPYVHSLQQGAANTVTGELTVSVIGGNTANSEFEFLTGHTMDFLPVGSIPYQQYITGEIPSLASQLKEQGYETYGMHPYNASGWNRDDVYPWLGFDKSYFIKDFAYRKYIRSYVSDESAYKKIIDIYEKNQDGAPLFIFEVTMQNHSSYSDWHDNYTPDITIEGSTNKALMQYISLMKVSDKAFQDLVKYFEGVEEDTMIVFFGDHQPSDYVANQVFRLNGVNPSALTKEQMALRYQVPYVIWANFAIEEETDYDMDISFLGANMLDLAGMELTNYQRFLLEYQKVLASDDGSKEAAKKTEEYTKQYQMIQYYYMFDYEVE